ncbi:MAG: hypothetical protein Q8Q39_05120 [bacterium]|nr:hypothetical protein [bacterium]
MHPTVLFVLGGFAALYALTATVFLLAAKIEKDANGQHYLNPDAWHFKFAYPRKQNAWWFRNTLARRGVSICPYFAKFFFMLYAGWPIIIILYTVTRIFYGAVMFLFGYYPSMGLMTFVNRWVYADAFFDEFQEGTAIRFLSIGKFRFLPVYLIAPLAYGWAWHIYPDTTLTITVWVAVAIVVIAAIVGSVLGIMRFRKKVQQGELKRVSLLGQFISAKKSRLCFTLKVKTN